MNLFIYFLLFFALIGCQKEDLSEKTVLSVNGYKLSTGDFATELGKRLFDLGPLNSTNPEVINVTKANIANDFISLSLAKSWLDSKNIRITENMINEKANDIKKQYPDEISFRQALIEESSSIKDWKNKIRDRLSEKMVVEQIGKTIRPPSDKEIKDYFKKHEKEFKVSERVKIRQIVLEKEDEARRIYSELKKKSSSFEDLARKYSAAPEGQNGGTLGWVEKGTLEIFDRAFKLPVGRRSEILKSPYGFHIIEVLGKKRAQNLSLNDAKDKIRSRILAQKEQEAYAAWLKLQMKSATIHRNDDIIHALKPITVGD